MLAGPLLSAILLEGAVPLPCAWLFPSLLLLPRDGLLLAALRLLLGRLRSWRLLRWRPRLRVLLGPLLLLLLLLSGLSRPCLLLLRLRLRLLSLLGLLLGWLSRPCLLRLLRLSLLGSLLQLLLLLRWLSRS